MIPVAPFAGAWIEICFFYSGVVSYIVAPFAGAWIEIRWIRYARLMAMMSLPSRERGLKFGGSDLTKAFYSRSLRGSVD